MATGGMWYVFPAAFLVESSTMMNSTYFLNLVTEK